MDSYDRGESIVMEIELEADLDMSAFDFITVKIVHKHLRSVLGRYSLQDSTVTLNDPTTDGIVNFTIPDSVTAAAPLGVYEYQVKTEDANGSPRFRVFTGDSFYLTKAQT